MAEHDILDTQNQELGNQDGQPADEPKTYTQEELNALLEKAHKEGETSGYVKGKTDTKNKLTKEYEEKMRLKEEETAKNLKFEKMSDLQKAETRASEAEEQLQRLKDQIALNEQKEETRKLMKDKDLPDVFLESVLVFKDAEATLQNIIDVKALFDAEVQKAVEGRIKTHTPKQNTAPDGGFTEEMARKALKLKSL